tara:strand:- start:165 stop:323 length:159 start_codon:yes stop_codon:yes gene_type:complete
LLLSILAMIKNRPKKDPIFVPPVLSTTDGRVQLLAAPGYTAARLMRRRGQLS